MGIINYLSNMPIAVLLTTIPTQQIEKLTTPSKWAVGGRGPPSTDEEDALVVADSSDLDKSRRTGMLTITLKVSLRKLLDRAKSGQATLHYY